MSLFIAQWFLQDLSGYKTASHLENRVVGGCTAAGLTELSLYSGCLLAAFTLTSDDLAVHIQLPAPEVTEVLLGGPSPLRIHCLVQCLNTPDSTKQVI